MQTPFSVYILCKINLAVVFDQPNQAFIVFYFKKQVPITQEGFPGKKIKNEQLQRLYGGTS